MIIILDTTTKEAIELNTTKASEWLRNNYERLGLVFFMQINSFDAKKDRTNINFSLIGFNKDTKIITAAQYIKDKKINTKEY